MSNYETHSLGIKNSYIYFWNIRVNTGINECTVSPDTFSIAGLQTWARNIAVWNVNTNPRFFACKITMLYDVLGAILIIGDILRKEGGSTQCHRLTMHYLHFEALILVLWEVKSFVWHQDQHPEATFCMMHLIV